MVPLIRQTFLPVSVKTLILQAHLHVKITYLGHHEHLVLGIMLQDGFFSGEAQNEGILAVCEAVFIQKNLQRVLGMSYQGILTAWNCDLRHCSPTRGILP